MKIYRTSDIWRILKMIMLVNAIIGVAVFIATGGLSPFFNFFLIIVCLEIPFLVILIYSTRKIVIKNNQLIVKQPQDSFIVNISDITHLYFNITQRVLTAAYLPVEIPVLQVFSTKEIGALEILYKSYNMDSIKEIINYILSVNKQVIICDEINSFLHEIEYKRG